MVHLFPLSEYWWFYLAFVGLVLFLLALDLGVFHRKAHSVSFREAATWSVVWISLALLFNLFLYQYALWKFPQDARLMAIPGFDPQAAAWRVSLEYLTGYLIEKALSVDNIFVFVMVFSYFAIPAKYQHRVLFYGILGALIFRAIFVALGAALMQYHWIVLLFGGFLIFTGVKIFFANHKAVDPDKNLLIRLLHRLLPVTRTLHGPDFLTRQQGRLYATPLLVAVVFLEATDIVFAVDSVPAIFAITSEPLVVFTSNIFAILGLRALYFMLAGAVDRFYLLQYGLGVVLVFVGLKMVWLNDLFGGKFPITISLGTIAFVITASIVLSLVFPKRSPGEDSDHPRLPLPDDAALTKIADQRAPSGETLLIRQKSIPPTSIQMNTGDGFPKASPSAAPVVRMHPRVGETQRRVYSSKERLSPTTTRFLWKVLAFYLLLLGLSLILTIAL